MKDIKNISVLIAPQLSSLGKVLKGKKSQVQS